MQFFESRAGNQHLLSESCRPDTAFDAFYPSSHVISMTQPGWPYRLSQSR